MSGKNAAVPVLNVCAERGSQGIHSSIGLRCFLRSPERFHRYPECGPVETKVAHQQGRCRYYQFGTRSN